MAASEYDVLLEDPPAPNAAPASEYDALFEAPAGGSEYDALFADDPPASAAPAEPVAPLATAAVEQAGLGDLPQLDYPAGLVPAIPDQKLVSGDSIMAKQMGAFGDPLSMAEQVIAPIGAGMANAPKAAMQAVNYVDYLFYKPVDALLGTKFSEGYAGQMSARAGEMAQNTKLATTAGGETYGSVASALGEQLPLLPVQLATAGGASALSATAQAGVKSALAASSAIGGLQSGSASFAQGVKARVDRGEKTEAAADAEFLPSVASGLITAATTQAFGATGIESIFRQSGGRTAMQKVGEALKQGGFEVAEEITDEAGQIVNDLVNGKKVTVEEAAKRVGTAAVVASILGTGVAGLHAAMATAPAPVPPKVQLATELEAAGATLTARAVAEVPAPTTDQPPIAPESVVAPKLSEPSPEKAGGASPDSAGEPTVVPAEGSTLSAPPPIAETAPPATPALPEPAAKTIANEAQTEAVAEIPSPAQGEADAPKFGILPRNPFVPEAVANDLPKASVPKAVDVKVEARYSAARLEQKSWLDRGREALKSAQESFTRHFIELDPKTDGAVIDVLRVAESIPQRAQYEAANSMHSVVQTLGPNKYSVFNRVLVLRDMLKDVDRGLHDSGDLPFGYKSKAEIETDLDQFEATANASPDIKTALEQRQKLIHGVRDELVQRGLLPEAVKDYDDYFHRQVLEHYAMKEAVTSGTGRKDARVGEKGFQKGRIGSAKDFNTSYVESEFEVLAQARSQIAMQDTLARIKDTADITPQLEAQAKASGKPVDSLIPSDHTKWQPERGNFFYAANTLADKALEAFLKGTKTLTEGDFKKAVALGGKKPEWIIPKRLAQTLDDMSPPPESAVSRFTAKTVSGWKQWTLINPYRVIKYNLNNLSGDLDIALAADPGILKGAWKAAVDSRKARQGKPFADESDLRRLDVIGSGFSVKEVPDLMRHEWFETLEGRRPNIIEKYWRTAKNFTQWREDILRIAAYRNFLGRINAGEKVYGASKKAEIDAVTNPKEKAAKLARELIGDYGNVSEAGQWIRSHMIPFYSWMEINAPRYVRLMKNLPDEGKSVSRVPAVAAWQLGKKATGLTLKAAALYTAASLWNKAFFADEEDELGDAERRQMHLILGRDAQGKIITLRIQGALSDALSWFGGEDLPSDVADVAAGKASIQDKLMDAMKAPAVKLITASQPIYKTMIETSAGVSLYPDPFNPRPIRDRMEHAARALSVQEIYRRMAGKPKPTVKNDVLSLITYTIDPGEAAYFSTRAMVQDFLEKKGIDKPGVEPTKRQNALYYYKQAIRYGDKPAAERFLSEYKAAGGKDSGIKSSIEKSSPLNGLKWGGKDYRKDFDQSLSPHEKEVIRRAELWHTKVYR